VERLPGSAEHDPFERLAMAFLVGYTASSARAYLADLKAWAAACAQMGTHPFDARRHHVDAPLTGCGPARGDQRLGGDLAADHSDRRRRG
jgi:hypothetical protein